MPRFTPKTATKERVDSNNIPLSKLRKIRDSLQVMHFDQNNIPTNSRIIDFDHSQEGEKAGRNEEYDRYAGVFVYAFVTEARITFFNGHSEVVKRIPEKGWPDGTDQR